MGPPGRPVGGASASGKAAPKGGAGARAGGGPNAPSKAVAGAGGKKGGGVAGGGGFEVSNNVPRLVEHGYDLTPLPLRAPNKKKTVELPGAKAPAPAPVKEQRVGALQKKSNIISETAELAELIDESFSTSSMLDDDDDDDDDESDDNDNERGESTLVTQTLTESPTEFLLHVAGICVATDAPAKAKIEERNAAYDKLVKERAASDKYTQRHVQTLNCAQKNAEVTVSPPATCEMGVDATSWDIWDAVEAQERASREREESDVPKAQSWKKVLQSKLASQMKKSLSVALASPDFLLDVSEAQSKGAVSSRSKAKASSTSSVAAPSVSIIIGTDDMSSTEQVLFEQKSLQILSSRSLSSSLATMERCVQQNLFHTKQLRYRNHLSAEEVTEAAEALKKKQLEEEQEEDEEEEACLEEDAEEDLEEDEKRSTTNEEETAVVEEKPVTEEEQEAEAEAEVEPESEEPLEAAKTRSGPLAAAAAVPASLELLWAWSAPITKGRTVTNMSWNRVNADILAVGYGSLSYDAPKSGLVLFWSLRNPTFPERVFNLPSGCTALDFSKLTPHLLAVGMHDGTVAIYNVRRESTEPDKESDPLLGASSGGGASPSSPAVAVGGKEDFAVPVLDSDNSAGKHMDPVWQVQWVDKGSERGESLVSISTDGRVIEWSMKKGLEDTCLMILKRVGASEGVISRQASGLCFDFARDDAAIYLAGTEDGLVHRCSCSYNEQYLETYSGHTGPVYRIRYSPFWNPVFLSCSADWTVKLWHMKDAKAAHTFQSVDLADVVHDVAWSPHTSTVFASVAGDGRMELWDLAHSTLDPLIRQFNTPEAERAAHRFEKASSNADNLNTLNNNNMDDDDDLPPPPPSTSLTSVLFATQDAPVLVVGDSAGAVTCYSIKGMLNTDNVDPIANLKASMYPEANLDSSSTNSRGSSSKDNKEANASGSSQNSPAAKKQQQQQQPN